MEGSLQGLSLNTSVPSVSAPVAVRDLASRTCSSAEWWGPLSVRLERSPRLMSSSPLTSQGEETEGQEGRKWAHLISQRWLLLESRSDVQFEKGNLWLVFKGTLYEGPSWSDILRT